MDKRDDFLYAWRTRFPVTDIPPGVVECLGSSDTSKIEEVLKECQDRVVRLQNELHQQEFLASYLWDCVKNKTSPAVSLNDSDLDKPIPVSDFSPNEHQESSSYDNIDQQTGKPFVPTPDNNDSASGNRSPGTDSNVLPSQVLRAQKPVPAPRANSHIVSVKDRASAFVAQTPKELPVPPSKFPNRGNSLDSKASPTYSAKESTATPSLSQHSMKKERPSVPPKHRKHAHAYEEIDIPLCSPAVKTNSFGKQNSVDSVSLGDSSSMSSSMHGMPTVSSKDTEYENLNTGVSSFKPIGKPKTSSLSPKLRRGSPLYSSKQGRTGARSPAAVASAASKRDEIYDEPIPLTGAVVDDDGSSSDEEPIYHNLMLLKKQQQSMDSRLYSSVDIFKTRLEQDAQRLSHRFSTTTEKQKRKSMKPVKAPVMRPLTTKSTLISGVTEEESSTESGNHRENLSERDTGVFF